MAVQAEAQAMSIKRRSQVSVSDQKGAVQLLNSLADQALYSDVEVTFSSGVAQRIPHKLGRPIKGWFVIRKAFSGDVYESGVSQDESREVYLTAGGSGDATVRFI